MKKPRQDLLSPPVILVDDEDSILQSFSLYLRSSGLKQVVSIQDSRELLPFLSKNEGSVILLDLFMPHMSGIQLLPEIKAKHPEIPVIVITASQEVSTAVNCMRDGAFDYMVKPVEKSRLVSAVKRAVEIFSLRRKSALLKSICSTITYITVNRFPPSSPEINGCVPFFNIWKPLPGRGNLC